MAFRLLVVNPDRDAQRASEQVLLSAGYAVTCVSTFQEAKRRLADAPPDLLLTDVRLGAYNGVHLLVRARALYSSMPVIVVDAGYDRVLQSEVVKVGATYVARPLRPRSLVALVRKLVEANRKPPFAINRRFPRKPATVSAKVAGAEAKIIEASYGGLRLELAGIPNVKMSQPATVDIASIGAVPIRPIWVKGATMLRVWWCGVEIAALDWQTANAWRGFVDSLN